MLESISYLYFNLLMISSKEVVCFSVGAASCRDDLAGSHSHKGGLIADKTMQRALSR
jgi:hypothetical protein